MGWPGIPQSPQWRTAFEAADVILGVDVTTGREILVFGRGALEMSEVTEMTDQFRVLRVSIDRAGEDLELLTAACEVVRGHHDFRTGA